MFGGNVALNMEFYFIILVIPRVYKRPRVCNSAYQVSDVGISHHVILDLLYLFEVPLGSPLYHFSYIQE